MDSSLQYSQFDQVADSFWNGSGQLVSKQVSMIRSPARSNHMSGALKRESGKSPYNTVRSTRLQTPSGMVPLSWFWFSCLCIQPSRLLELSSKNVERDASYKTLKLVRQLIPFGMVPLKLFPYKFLSSKSRNVRLPDGLPKSRRANGIAPYKRSSLTRLLIPSGMGPLSWFANKFL